MISNDNEHHNNNDDNNDVSAQGEAVSSQSKMKIVSCRLQAGLYIYIYIHIHIYRCIIIIIIISLPLSLYIYIYICTLYIMETVGHHRKVTLTITIAWLYNQTNVRH